MDLAGMGLVELQMQKINPQLGARGLTEEQLGKTCNSDIYVIHSFVRSVEEAVEEAMIEAIVVICVF